jgi:hypothetical protein
MQLNSRVIALMVSAAVLATTSAMTGCAGGGLVYDSYSDGYYRWNHGEDRFYRRWEIETHRRHMDFGRRNPTDQGRYWGWRHQQQPDGREGTTRRSHR